MAAHRSSLLSPESMKAIARDLGVAHIVEREGWGGVPSRQCGMVVRVAVEAAERLLAADDGRGYRAAAGRR